MAETFTCTLEWTGAPGGSTADVGGGEVSG